MNPEIKYPRRLLIRRIIQQLSKAAFFLLSDFRVEGETVFVESKTLSLTMIFLNGERCLVSVFKFPNGVLRSYYNQDKIKEDER